MILFLSIVLRILYYGHVDYDEVTWVTGAKNFLAGNFDPLFNSSRYVFMFIVAFFVYFFGTSHLAIVPITLLSTIATIIIVYFIGKKLFSRKIGLIAAFLLAILPINIKYSSILESDVTLSLIIGICFLIYLYKQNWKGTFVIGILLSLGTYIKPFILFFLFFIGIDLLKENQWRRLIILLLGFFIGVMPFLIHHYILTDDYFFYINNFSKGIDEFNQIHNDNEINFFFHYIFNPFSKWPEPSLFNIYYFLILFYFLYCIKIKNFQNYFLWLWFIGGYLFLELLPQIPTIQRYLIFTEIPLVLLLAISLSKIYNKFILGTIFICLIFISLFQLGNITVFDNEPRTIEERITNVLKTFPQKDIYFTHYSSIPYFTYFLGYKHSYAGPTNKSPGFSFEYRDTTNYSLYDLHFVKNYSDIHNAYVFLDFRYFKNDQDLFGYYLQNNGTLETLKQEDLLPAGWERVIEVKNTEGTLVGGVWFAN